MTLKTLCLTIATTLAGALMLSGCATTEPRIHRGCHKDTSRSGKGVGQAIHHHARPATPAASEEVPQE